MNGFLLTNGMYWVAQGFLMAGSLSLYNPARTFVISLLRSVYAFDSSHMIYVVYTDFLGNKKIYRCAGVEVPEVQKIVFTLG